ncbi:hypothetical protein [Stappia sp. WLB 29]|uniref:hypothetical protein n=1 Tax=Stappia sp. WLB 29 TaxID=2925220 RepID=UPI0020BDC4E4|nr:hypothetical protein [Stappia sp. WLB 29]
MDSRFPLDPFARPEAPLPQIGGPHDRSPDSGSGKGRLTDAALVAGAAVGLTLSLALVLFVPQALQEFDRLDAVVSAGTSVPAAEFAERLFTLFLGLMVLAAAVSAFILSVLMTPAAPRPVFPAGRHAVMRRSDRPRGSHEDLRHVRPV